MQNQEELLAALRSGTQFIDTHCHLDMGAYQNELAPVLENARKNLISKTITIGIDLESSKKAVLLAKKYKNVHPTIGIHPHDVNNINPQTYSDLTALFSRNQERIVGFGEIGLDYVKNYSPPAKQREHFRHQLELAHDLELPIIVHNREADEDTLNIISESKPLSHGGIMHCFSGDYSYAKKIMDLGMMISIPGIVTFKNATILQEVATKIPLSKMLLETDGPFLAPHPFRGKRNEPAYLLYTAIKIAELRDIPLQEVADVTTENAISLFRLKG